MSEVGAGEHAPGSQEANRIRFLQDAIGVVLDVTEQRRAEQELATSDEFLRTILHTSLDGFWIVDPAGRLMDVNPAYCAMSGYSREELLAMRIPDLEANETPEETRANIQRLIAAGGGRFERTQRRKDGSLFHVDISVTFIGGPTGAMVCFLRDITERKRTEAALRESAAEYRVLVDNLNAGVIVYGSDLSVQICNAKACSLLGITEEEIVGKGLSGARWSLVDEDGGTIPEEEYLAVQVAATGAPFVNRVQGIRRADMQGGEAWILVGANPVYGESGQLLQIVITFTDITRRKEAEEALRKTQEQLIIASRLAAMGTLVGGVAHEINNPLAGTLSGQALALDDVRSIRARLLEEGPLDREALAKVLDGAAEALEDAQTGAQRVARIVKDMTTYGRPDPRRSRVKLIVAVREAMRWLPESVASQTELHVEDHGAPDVLASSGQIGQVVVNLVTNAAKAMPGGRIGRIAISCRSGPAGKAWLDVTDDGTGMSPETMKRVFDPFFTTRPVGEGRGTGLGLSISHAIATAHGGTLTVRSEPGKGSTFRLELPGVAG